MECRRKTLEYLLFIIHIKFLIVILKKILINFEKIETLLVGSQIFCKKSKHIDFIWSEACSQRGYDIP